MSVSICKLHLLDSLLLSDKDLATNIIDKSLSKIKTIDTSTQTTALETLAAQSISTAQANEDRIMIEAALGGTEHSHIERFQKEYGVTMQSIMDATIQELAEVRKSGLNVVGFGGLKKAKIKKWKFVVKLDDKGKITELLIGQFKASGTFTKVYITLNEKAILVPRKLLNSKNQILQAYNNILHLHRQCELKQKLTTKEKQELLEVLPSIPEKIMVGGRPIMVAPQATCVEGIFHKPPRNTQDIIDRFQILRDTAKSIAYIHEIGMVHGDLKPANMLISHNGRSHPSDFGGSSIFYQTDSPTEAALKYRTMAMTSSYTHYQDELQKDVLIGKGVAAGYLASLGSARDVFALGVSTIEALTGRYDSKGNKQLPFQKSAYLKKDGNDYINGQSNLRQKITCIRDISTEIDVKVQELLDRTLQQKYSQRITAKDYVVVLNRIINQLMDAAD